jgi:hypothetical protein
LDESHLGVILFLEHFACVPNTRNSCPLPQYRLQNPLFPPTIAKISGTKKSIMPSHANRILKNPSAKYMIDQIHR